MEEILKRLEYLANQIGNLNLDDKNVCEVEPLKRSRAKTSLPDEPELYGRNTDEDALMKLLMPDEDSNEKICVIPIVGMGGIGKTTLAQILFNDERVNLTEKVTGKKFLIVLDDIWEEYSEEWKEVMKPFHSGARGSRIIVTTRNEKVADIIQTAHTHHLKELSKDECWKLFAKAASSSGNC
ncbi:putative disease resistance RPP13-like protein 1 [Cannabis sativa]|uniref:putative disease resistance RPP13-like protein 1 n=1 Tax=Cannabis sativa TaxID=3483 RepID=UPI0029CA8CBD|nr:putative disease resistance RPP13-like protein 1 [Cannabis sativa]